MCRVREERWRRCARPESDLRGAGWSRAAPEEYQCLDLRAHALLADAPLHDVWRVELPGGGPGRSLVDVRWLLGFDAISSLGPVVRGLFRLRGAMGRLFGWDTVDTETAGLASLRTIDAELRSASLVEPGSRDGPFALLYLLPDESVSEVRNATVHAFSVQALVACESGYRLYWAIHIRPVGGLTRVYMALIDPFRHWIVYPAILGHAHRRWRETYAEAGSD